MASGEISSCCCLVICFVTSVITASCWLSGVSSLEIVLVGTSSVLGIIS
jgi:hypothetical protein